MNTELIDVIRVVPLPNYQLELTFANDEVRVFDMTAYLHKKPFNQLTEQNRFMTARVYYGTVVWDGNIDISPETLYDRSKALNSMKVLMIAGPQWRGQNNLCEKFLPQEAHVLRFINADLIAAGLSPFAPEHMAVKAGRLMLQEVKESVEKRESFAIETTLSGSTYLKHIRAWQSLGYEVSLFFLKLSSVELAIERVAQRVKQGGHNIPEPVIHRRYKAGLDNFAKYAEQVDNWSLFDNDDNIPIKLASGGCNASLTK